MLAGIFAALLLQFLRLTVPFPIAIVLIAPLVIDGFTQLFGLRQSTNEIRFATGILFAIGLIAAETRIIHQILT